MFKTILLAYDGSDHAQNALKVAAEMVRAFDAKLHVSHTPQTDTTIVLGAFVGALPQMPSDEEIAEIGRELMEKAQAEAQGHGINITKSHIARGDPAQNVLHVAKEIDADMIIMGRRGLGSVRALTLGSVSQAVSHGAKCACLTVV